MTSPIRPVREISQEEQSRPPSALTAATGLTTKDCVENGQRSAAPESTMTVVSVVEEGSRIAFACYNEGKNIITLDDTHANSYETEETVERFYMAARPNMVLVSNKSASNAAFLNVLTTPPPQVEEDKDEAEEVNCDGKKDSQQHVSENLPGNSSIPYRLMKNGAFDLKRCQDVILKKLRILDLLCNKQDQQQSQNENHEVPLGHFEASAYHSIASVVDFDSNVLVRALGSLLSFLQSTLFRLEEGNTVTVNSVVQANSSLFMRLKSSTLSALHIFTTEHHPLLAKGQGHSKEGFSLFSLLDRTKSKMGRKCLREWMLKPLFDLSMIQRRQDGVEMFLCSEFEGPTGALLQNLENVGAIDRVLTRMAKCQAVGMDFIVLVRSLSSALDICHTMEKEFLPKVTKIIKNLRNNNSSDAERFDAYMTFTKSILQNCCAQSLRDVQARIADIIDQEATAEEKNTVVIKLGFHEELDCAKEKFESLDDILSEAGIKVIYDYPHLRNVKAVFLHQLGFLVAIQKSEHQLNEDTNSFPGLPQDFKNIFSTATEAFYKTSLMRELDNSIGDIHGYICDTERMIVTTLEEDILDHECNLRRTFDAIAELDCILCFAACADDLKFTRPNVVNQKERCVQIKNGRHPLQEIIIDGSYVPNNTSIDSRNRVSVVTGPNFSGKSCYTRQVGVIVYMAHIGCFVPADEAKISMTDQILTRITTVETCATPQSSFQLEMTEMGSILRKATTFSLVLVDEFGKGTSPSSGVAVLVAVLKKFSAMKCNVVCTTHFLEIFSLNLVRDGIGAIKAFQMKVQLPTEDTDDGGSGGFAKPLFKIEEGVATSSAGLLCAAKAGVSKSITNRAKDILRVLQSGDSESSIQPLEEIFDPPMELSQDEYEALTIFLSTPNWKDASDEKLRRLMHHISRM